MQDRHVCRVSVKVDPLDRYLIEEKPLNKEEGTGRKRWVGVGQKIGTLHKMNVSLPFSRCHMLRL